jgi:hypothetical protein
LRGFEVIDVSRKLPALDFHHLYRRYETGETPAHIAASVGIGGTTLRRRLKPFGYGGRRPGKRPTDAVLRDLYVRQGLGSPAISGQLGVTSGTVRSWLRELGITRTPSESSRLWNARLGPEGRQRNAAAAHEAVRGMTRTLDDLCARAQSREQRGLHISPLDRQLASWLEAAGLPVTLGKAIGPYNVDIATGTIAVEVFGGAWHGGGRALARWPKRARYLLDCGWSVVVVWVQPPRYPLAIETVEYIVSLAQRVGSDPAAVAQYRVVRGAGQELICGCAQDDDFPVVPPGKRGTRIRCPHHAAAD